MRVRMISGLAAKFNLPYVNRLERMILAIRCFRRTVRMISGVAKRDALEVIEVLVEGGFR